MPKIKITDSEGAELFGTIPTSWDSTPLAPYAALATATTLPEKCAAVAALLGLPPEPFLADASLLLPIRKAAPWLFDGSLPPSGEPVLLFTHQGQGYEHVGNLEKVSAEQLEALLSFLKEHQGKPLAAAPSLLAVLYKPIGHAQTADAVEATAKAFQTLPLSLAWPALTFFLSSSSVRALSIRTAWAVEKQFSDLLQTLEAAVKTDGASPTFLSNTRRKLTLLWLSHARKVLW